MDARLIQRAKRILAGGLIIEIVVWRVPTPVPGSTHLYKYRLFFAREGERIIGYDNERGKGDHRHVEGKELSYRFISVDSLEADFHRDIEAWRSHQ